MNNKHKVFISFHHEDKSYKDWLIRTLGQAYIVDQSLNDEAMEHHKDSEMVQKNLHDEFIRDAVVTVVLVGPSTWQRKQVDWEIASSLRTTEHNARCGLLAYLLPNHIEYGKAQYRYKLLPPRLADNLKGDDSFGSLHSLPLRPPSMYDREIKSIDGIYYSLDTPAIFTHIHNALLRSRQEPAPINKRKPLSQNLPGCRLIGWKN